MKIEVMNGYIMEANSFIVTWDWMRDKLHLRKGALRDTYALIYSYTHNDADTWFVLGNAEIQKRTDSTVNTVKNSLSALIDAGFITEKKVRIDFNKTHTYYRINEQILIERGIWHKQENDIPNDNYNLPESVADTNLNHTVDFIPSEPEFVHEPIQNYGEYMNVRLTETEYRQLQEKFPDTFEYTLRRFSEKTYSKGYKWGSLSYFIALSEWCSEDAEKAKKKAENRQCQNLTKNSSIADTSNIYNITNNFDFNSSHSQTRKKTKNYSRPFNEVLSEMGSHFTAVSESELSFVSPDMRNTENCTLSYNLTRSEMTEALKFVSSFSYYQKQDPTSSFVLESEAVIELLAEIMVDGYKSKKGISYSGTEMTDRINSLIHGNFYFNDGLHDFINGFLKHYGKSLTENKLNDNPIWNHTVYMKTLLVDFVIHYKIRLTSDLAGLDYELKKYGTPVFYGENKKSHNSDDFNADDYDICVNNF